MQFNQNSKFQVSFMIPDQWLIEASLNLNPNPATFKDKDLQSNELKTHSRMRVMIPGCSAMLFLNLDPHNKGPGCRCFQSKRSEARAVSTSCGWFYGAGCDKYPVLMDLRGPWPRACDPRWRPLRGHPATCCQNTNGLPV